MEIKLVISDDVMFGKIEDEMSVDLRGNKGKIEFVKKLIEEGIAARNALQDNAYFRWTLK